MDKTFEIIVTLPEGVDVADVDNAIEDALDEIGCILLDFSEA